jgi:hypothetical protein
LVATGLEVLFFPDAVLVQQQIPPPVPFTDWAKDGIKVIWFFLQPDVLKIGCGR